MNTWYLQTFIPIQRIAQKLRFALFHNIFYETNMLYFCKLWNHKGYVNWVHKDTTIEKMDGCNWCRQITDLFQFIHARNQGGFIINNYDISLLQFLFCKNTVNLKEWVAPLALLFCYSSMDGCNWNCELSQYFWKKGWPQMLVSKKHSTTENSRSLQKAFWNKDGTTQMYGCKFSFEITICFK